MIFEASENFAQKFFAVGVTRLDAGGFAKIEPTVQAIARRGIFEFLFLVEARVGPRLLRAESHEGRSSIGKFGEGFLAGWSFSVGGWRGREADDKNLFAIDFEDAVGIDDSFVCEGT
jgi:hypothetical protein